MPWRGNTESIVTVDNSAAQKIFVNETGDKMKGTLDMNLNKIINIPTPVNRSDVANKEYVDISSINARLLVSNEFPKVYGFRLEKTVSSTDYETTVIIVVPNGVSPDRIFFHTYHPFIRDIDYRIVKEKGTHTPSKAHFHLKFLIPTELRPYQLVTEGLIYILPFDIITFSGKAVTFSLETNRPTVSINEVDDTLDSK
jgi:hypothetical protein